MVSAEKITIAVIALLLVVVAVLVFQFLSSDQEVELAPVINDETERIEPPLVTEISDAGPGGTTEGLSRERVAPVQPELLEEGEEAGGVYGRVISRNLAPVAGARVALCRGEMLFLEGAGEEVGVTDTTGPDGSYRLEGLLGEREYSVSVTHAQYAQTVRNPVIVRAGSMVEMADIIMEEGFVVFGRVTDESGIAQADMDVELFDPNAGIFDAERDILGTTKTDGTGNYRFENVPTRNFAVRASGKEFGSQTKRSTFFQSTREMEINFELGPSMQITGTVVGSDGLALEGAEVRATLTSSKKLFTTSSDTVTGPGGRFTVAGLTSGIYVVRAVYPGFSAQAEQRVLAGTTGLEITMHKQGGVSGVVRDESTGAPIAAYTIYVYKIRRGDSKFRIGEPRYVNSRDGSYLINDLDPDYYMLEVEAGDYATGASEKFKVEREDVKEGINVVLNRGGVLAGAVVDEHGDPLQGVRVTLRYNQNPDDLLFFFDGAHTDPRDLGDSGSTAVTDSSGRFVKKYITPGTYQVHFKRKGFTEKSVNDVTVFLGESSATDMGAIKLYTGGSVKGRALGAAGSILPGAVVVLTSEEGYKTQQMVTDKDGWFEFSHLPPGKYSAQVHADHLDEANDEFNIFDQLMVSEKSKVDFYLTEGENKQIVVQLIP